MPQFQQVLELPKRLSSIRVYFGPNKPFRVVLPTTDKCRKEFRFRNLSFASTDTDVDEQVSRNVQAAQGGNAGSRGRAGLAPCSVRQISKCANEWTDAYCHFIE